MRLGLANDPDLARGAGDDLRDSLISLHEAAHADGATAISHLGPSERSTVLDPNQNRESIRVGVVDAQVQESRRAVSRRCVTGPGDASLDSRDFANQAASPLPAGRAPARQRGLDICRRALGASGAGKRHRDRDNAKNRDSSQNSSVLWWVTPTIGLLLPFLNLDRQGSALLTPQPERLE